MPYTTPPTFADDDVLSASQLNILAENIEYLYGLAQSVNIPFAQVDTGLNFQLERYTIRHRARYLKVFVAWSVDLAHVDQIALKVTYGGVNIYDDVQLLTDSATLSLDLNPLTLTLATFYEITVSARVEDSMGVYAGVAGTSYVRLQGIWEAEV